MKTVSHSLCAEPFSFCVFKTQMGWMGLLGKQGEVAKCVLPRESREEALAGLIESAVEDALAFGDLPDRLKRYFAGEQVDFSNVCVDLSQMTDFTARVLSACRTIPYGNKLSYAELAKNIGSANAARAVGAALSRNPVPIIIPCHRVVASDGTVGGFSAGVDWKTRLLRLEGMQV